ncbi:hypothetical protein [Mycobacterium sp. 236(2023)]|uniref:hypothetical protein n=1 Tax=Mycobacterium sp. 236(2023) TaxID=3038163 RepID=UPI002414E636|nr:hypothetical protein [Mycobacterium sp. 236(2023)]MDG4664923.1 hypothetical protein [Mycobacterium sp. 236(2023)]
MASRRFNPSGGATGRAPVHHHRIVVIASTVGALVESAGGFLCDRARQGWDVGVLLRRHCDARPLSILGVSDHAMLDDDVASGIETLAPGATLLICADLFVGDGGVQRELVRRAAQGRDTVTVCGRPTDTDVTQGLELMPHTPSAAATAFKTSALRAAHIEAAGEPVEELYRLRGAAFRRLRAV